MTRERHQLQSLLISLLRWIKRPSTIAVSASAIAFGTVSYAGALVLINKYLPILIETELSKTLNRKVLIGQVQRLSVTGFRLGPSSIPATPTKPNYVSLPAVEVSLNPLPLLQGRALLANVTLIEPNVFAQQDKSGELIDTDDIKEPQLPVPIDTNIRIANGEITLIPIDKKTKLTLQLDGTITIPYGESQPVKYDIAAAIASGELKVKGETLSRTGKSKVSARVENLPLVQLSSFIPNSPVSLTSGELDAFLEISLPSLKEIPSVQGTAVFEHLTAQAEQLPLPIQASTLLRFQGQRVSVENTKGSYGAVNAIVSGEVDWVKGFDLAVDVKISDTSAIASLYKLPGNITLGTSAAQAQIRGTIANPQALVKWQLQPRLATATTEIDISGTSQISLINQNLLRANTKLQIQLAKLGTPIAAQVSGDVNLLGNIKNLNPQALLAIADLQVDLAQGKVDLISKLQRGQWQANINAANLDPSLLSQQLLGDKSQASLTLPALNAQLSLSGNLDSLLNPDTAAAIAANTVSVQLGEQSLNASGLLTLANLTTHPEVSSLDLDIAARSNLQTLPRYLLVNQAFLPKINGQANFKGRLQGKNLLSAPLAPGNLNLTGNLRLLDFAINNVTFEPLLAGEVKIATGQEVAINLQGERDAIAARLDSCTQARCLVPYLPVSLKVRGGTAENSILLIGKRDGDRFNIKTENFSLALLNLTPATQFGIYKPVVGQVTGKLDINLFTLATAGNVQITQPSLGNIKTNKFAGSFSYDNGLAQLTTATLEFGQSRYLLNGSLNLDSDEVNGNVKIAAGEVQDILTTFGWWTLPDLLRGINHPGYASAAAVQPKPVGKPEESLFNQLRLLSLVDARIQRQNAKAQALPAQLDISGAYTGEITIAGTLANPQLNFEVWGHDWQWLPRPPVVRISQSDVVIEKSPVIHAKQVIVRGSFAKGAIALEPLQIELDDAVMSVVGKLSAANESGMLLQVANLSLDTVRNIFALPINITGKLNAKALLDGSPTNPQIQDGEISFVDGTINNRPLEEIQGKFSYIDSRLRFNTTQPSLLQVQVTAPFPPKPGVDEQLSLDVKLDTEAIAQLDSFTQGQFEWVDGQGEVQLQASARIGAEAIAVRDLVRDLVSTANASIKFNDATIKTAALEQEFKLNGEIALLNQRLRVKNLTGELAQNQLLITGVLPLFKPIRTSDLDASNPLTVSLERGTLDLENLYQGQINAGVVVTGTALSPVFGGEVSLARGRVSVSRESIATLLSLFDNTFQPNFENFRVALGDRFLLNLSPFRRLAGAKFRLAGAVTVNGSLDSLRPKGKIQLQRGNVNVLNSKFFLSRDHDSRVEFVPTQGLLNPNLDIEMKTVVFTESPYQRLQPIEGEIRDDIVTFGKPDQVNITLGIKGQTNQLLAIGEDAPESCQGQQNINLPTKGSVSTMAPEQLQKLAACIGPPALSTTSNSELLSAPLVTLSSTPSRSRSEILALLSEQFLANLSQLEIINNRRQLVDFAVTRYVVAPAFQKVLVSIQNLASQAGQSIGLTNVRIFPVLEGIRSLDADNKSFVGISYDYEFSEIKVRYQVEF